MIYANSWRLGKKAKPQADITERSPKDTVKYWKTSMSWNFFSPTFAVNAYVFWATETGACCGGRLKHLWSTGLTQNSSPWNFLSLTQHYILTFFILNESKTSPLAGKSVPCVCGPTDPSWVAPPLKVFAAVLTGLPRLQLSFHGVSQQRCPHTLLRWFG